MKPSRRTAILSALPAFALLLAAARSLTAQEQGRVIPLTLDAVAQPVKGYPVELGVPFLPGKLESVDLAVTRDGEVISSQVSEMVRWSGRNTGVKFAHVQFLADLDAKPAGDYAVVLKGKPASPPPWVRSP